MKPPETAFSSPAGWREQADAVVRRGQSRRFTYGYGRTEDVADAVIVLVIFFSAYVAAYESIQKLVHPAAMTHLW